MAAQNICFFNKFGFCKYLDHCRKHHENKLCENKECEVRECQLRHPIKCKYYRDFGYCKFGEWCSFSHRVHVNVSAGKENIEKLDEKLKTLESELDKNSENIKKLEAEIKDMNLKISEKDQTISKMNKKYNFLKEKVTILFDLESKFEVLEKRVEKVENKSDKSSGGDIVTESPQVENTSEIKCNVCDFVAKNKFGLKIHFHKKHSTAAFNCDTCDFTCENYSDLVEHNDRYYHSHRRRLNKENEKLILDEFQQLDADGFLIHRKLDW